MNKFGYWLHSNNPTSKKNKNNNISKMENKKILKYNYANKKIKKLESLYLKKLLMIIALIKV